MISSIGSNIGQEPIAHSPAETPTSSPVSGQSSTIETTQPLAFDSIEQPGLLSFLSDKFLSVFFRIKSPPASTLDATVDKKGRAIVSTSDNYKINFEGQRQEWSITGPDGKSTKIWGDPHVEESDGDKWDFYETSSFVFGQNKITVETTPSPQNGMTYSQTVTIYNGSERFTLTGIDNNKPKLVAWDWSAEQHDQSLGDGTTYQLNNGAGKELSWTKVV